MFSNKKNQKINEIDTVIGPGTNFEGNIEAIGIVRVDGSFSGDMTTQGDIIVGEQGQVKGNLKGRNMIIAGSSYAKLICEEKLEIKSSGKVIGDVEVGNIVIEEKAVFKGQCLMRYEEIDNSKGIGDE
ncbi:hypothetical protein BHF71_07935 [Vulcanibacillus modesticaldus]|uniref:Cell shape determination protein CcmA n=1 Tax=Vulcanibacillus modesticaldus TaxID=337097 RepID=A0A1D2YVJ6_9BACI|nr:polymer-forming cytoskeletal protein [Vulcanibacillus modesticaldus]OEF99677.1 hypothetical protein BHF71_07935 [Vulcanibacillus modesticaldus]